MKRLTLRIRDEAKGQALLAFLRSMDFVEVEPTTEEDSRKFPADHDAELFSAAGLWKDRDVDAGILRKTAWQRP